MLRVAGVASVILDHWQGPPVSRSMLVRVLLLHDMGNIVKIDDPGPRARELKQRYAQLYGRDDHQVSLAIGRELGLSDDELSLMAGKIFNSNDESASSTDYGRKIGAYSDQRVAPQGVMPLLERLEEARARYRDKPGSSMNNPRTAMMIEYSRQIEDQIREHVDLDLNAISTEWVDRLRPALLRTEI
jgi:hypothetical protein